MLSFAFLATVINYLNRQTLSVMAPVLIQQFHISATGYSQIIFAFMLAYTLMNGVSGRLLDRLGTRIGYGLTIAFWSGAELLNALSVGALSLGCFQFLLGVGEAGNYPAGVKLIAEWFPVEERSFASGIFNSGASIGAILAPPLLAWIVLASGWRTAFVIIGLLGFLWLAAWLVYYREPHAAACEGSGGASSSADAAAIEVPLAVHSFQGFQRSGLVFLCLLVPAVSQSSALIFTAGDRRNSLDSVLYGHRRESCGRGCIQRTVAYRTPRPATARRIAILIFSALMVSAVFVRQGSSASPNALLSSRLRPLDILERWQICWLFREMCFRKVRWLPSGDSPVWAQALEE